MNSQRLFQITDFFFVIVFPIRLVLTISPPGVVNSSITVSVQVTHKPQIKPAFSAWKCISAWWTLSKITKSPKSAEIVYETKGLERCSAQKIITQKSEDKLPTAYN